MAIENSSSASGLIAFSAASLLFPYAVVGRGKGVLFYDNTAVSVGCVYMKGAEEDQVANAVRFRFGGHVVGMVRR